MIIPIHILTELDGKICRLTQDAPYIDKAFKHNWCQTKRLLIFQEIYDLKFMFIDEQPFWKHNHWWYCIKEIGKEADDNWYWYSLNQLMICVE